MERNGRASSSKRTRHINIRYFSVCDRVNMKEIRVLEPARICRGSHFRKLRDYIMGRVRCVKPKGEISVKTKVGIKGRKIMPQ